MKYLKLFLLIGFCLASCSGPVRLAPTREPIFPLSTFDVVGTAPVPVTSDSKMGNIEGNISWLVSSTSAKVPITKVNLEINGHSGSRPKYTTQVGPNGHFAFANIEPGDHGFGLYFNLPISDRLCEAPEYIYSADLGWSHYATSLQGEIWYDILFSSMDVTVNRGETVILDFVLKCP